MKEKSKGKAGSAKSAKVGIPPLLRASTTTSSSAALAEAAAQCSASKAKAGAAQQAESAALPEERRFSMFDDWQPDAAHFALLASAHGVNPESLTADVLLQWCMYCRIKQPERQQTQQQWEYQLVQRLKHVQDEAAEKAARQAELAAQRHAQEAQAVAETPASSKTTNKPAKVVKLRSVSAPPGAYRPKPTPAQSTGQNSMNTTIESENPFTQELAQSEQESTILGYLWDELRGLYGWRLLSNFGDKPSGAWARALRGLAPEKLTNGMRNLIEQAPSWPPSALEFRGLCLQIPGLPSASKAWTQALAGTYSHEAVQRAAKLCGIDALKSARAGHCDRFAVQSLKERFEMHYALIVEKLQAGETPETGSEAPECGDAQQRQEAYHEYERLKRLIECGERSTAGNDLRRQAVQARQQIAPLCEQFGFPLPAAPVSAASGNVQSLHQGRAA